MAERNRRATRREQYTSASYRELQARLARNIYQFRAQSGWTQEEAAHRCSMPTRLLQGLEAADTNATLTTLARICEGFDVDPQNLFAAKQSPRSRKEHG